MSRTEPSETRTRSPRQGWGTQLRPVGEFFAKRLVTSLILLLLVSLLTFVLLSLSGGSVADTLLGSGATPQAVHKLDIQLHLTAPLLSQYWSWLSKALTGNFGTALTSGEPVRQEISKLLAPTLSVVLVTMIVSVVIGVGLGTLSALRGGWTARLVDALSLLGLSVPSFIVGLLLLLLVAKHVHAFAIGGYVPLSQDPGQWLASLVLPVVALTLGNLANLSKQVRAAVLDALGSEHVTTLRANGFPRRKLVYKYILRSAAVPTLAVIGITAVGTLNGTVLIEDIFGIPGIGALAATATAQKDITTVQAVALLFTLFVVLVNIALDVLYVVANPRVDLQ